MVALLNTNVLVLNNSFQPLHVCHARRALVLVLGGKAEVVEYYDKSFARSVSRRFQLPSVVRLHIYINPSMRSVVLNRIAQPHANGHRGRPRLDHLADWLVEGAIVAMFDQPCEITIRE